MLNKVYVIYDTKAEQWSLPFYYSDDVIFERSLMSLFLSKPEAMNFATDNEYYCLGQYETDNGQFILHDPLKVFTGFEIVKKVNDYKKQLEKISNDSDEVKKWF